MLLISGEHCHQYILISLKYVVKPNQTDPVIFWGKSKSKGRLQERRSNLRSVESHSTLESALNQFSLQENIVLPSWVYYRSIVTSCIAYHFRDIFAYSNINVIYASLKSWATILLLTIQVYAIRLTSVLIDIRADRKYFALLSIHYSHIADDRISPCLLAELVPLCLFLLVLLRYSVYQWCLITEKQQSGSAVPVLRTMEQLYFDVNRSVNRRFAPRTTLVTSLLQLGRLCSQSFKHEYIFL